MDSQITEVIGWLGFALVSIGYYLNARKKLYCFFVWGLGNAVYILYGFIISAFPIIDMSIFVLGMNILLSLYKYIFCYILIFFF